VHLLQWIPPWCIHIYPLYSTLYSLWKASFDVNASEKTSLISTLPLIYMFWFPSLCVLSTQRPSFTGRVLRNLGYIIMYWSISLLTLSLSLRKEICYFHFLDFIGSRTVNKFFFFLKMKLKKWNVTVLMCSQNSCIRNIILNATVLGGGPNRRCLELMPLKKWLETVSSHTCPHLLPGEDAARRASSNAGILILDLASRLW
jgi:hypothetical protein